MTRGDDGRRLGLTDRGSNAAALRIANTSGATAACLQVAALATEAVLFGARLLRHRLVNEREQRRQRVGHVLDVAGHHVLHRREAHEALEELLEGT